MQVKSGLQSRFFCAIIYSPMSQTQKNRGRGRPPGAPNRAYAEGEPLDQIIRVPIGPRLLKTAVETVGQRHRLPGWIRGLIREAVYGPRKPLRGSRRRAPADPIGNKN